METSYNKLLIRQIKRHFGSLDALPEGVFNFIQDINNTYLSFDEDSKLLQNSIEISSQELRNAFEKQKIDAENQRNIINKIKKAILTLNPEVENVDSEIKTEADDSNYLFDSLINLIEESKKAEEEILKLSKAVEQNNASIVITDVKGNIEYVNPKFCKLTGYSKEEVLGHNPRILKSNTTTHDYSAKLWETIIAGKEWTGELQNIKKNGELFWESASISPIFNENKQITHFIAIKEDITQKKKEEEEKIRQTGLITSLLDSIPEIIFFKDINGIYLGCNPPFAKFVGKEKNEIIGKTDYNLFEKEIADEFRYFDNEMLIEKKPKHNEEWIIYPDGKKILLDTLKTPYWASDGSLIGILGISRDITLRKEAEEALRLSSQKFEAIISASPDGIGMAGIDGKIQLMSEKLATMHGYSVDRIEDYIGKSIFDFIDNSNHELLSKNLNNLIQGNKNNKISEYLALKKDGTKFYSDVNSTILFDKNGNPNSILFVERDITERKLAEEALQSKTSLLEAQTNATIDAILIVDLNNKRLLINQRTVDIFDVPQFILDDDDDSLLLKHVVGLTKYPDKFLKKVNYLYENKKEISHDEVELKNGMILDRYSAPVLGKDGKNYGRIWTFRDITENKKAEEEIKRNAGLITSLLDSIPDIIFFKDKNGVYLGGNPAFEEFSGRSKKELIGITDYEIFDKEKADAFVFQDKEIIESRKPIHNDLWITYPNGRKILVDTLKTPYLGPDGSLIGILGISRDITERKLAEEMLQNERTLFRTIIDLIPDAVYVKDIEGKKILANPKEVELLGLKSESEIIGNTDYNLLPDNEAKFSQSQDMKVISTGEALMNIESTLNDKNGKQHWLLGSKVPLRDIHGNITGIVGVTHDISDRKKAEDDLKQLTTRLELATRAGGVGVWELDILSDSLYWDDQMFELYGFDKRQFDNAYSAWQNSLHPEDKTRADEEIKLAINGEKEFNTEFRIVYPDNSIHNIRALATVLNDNEGKPIRMIGTNWDITDQKNSEKNLMNYTTQIEMKNLELDMALTNSEQATAHAYAMAAEAEMANKSKSIFLANMSHEIRTPLNAIIGFSQLLNRDQQLTKQQKDYNLSIIRAGEHLLALINEILELSKIEAGKITLNYNHIDLHELLNDIRLIFKESAKTKQLEFNLETDESMPQYAIADESKLRQIFVNLIGNAIKFTDEGNIKVNVKSERTENYVIKLIVEIKDTGCGIDENEINSLFKHFVQTSSGINKGSGTGLGLALSRELALLMGGDISVSSTKGIGSIFTFSVLLNEGNMEEVEKENLNKIIRIADNQKKYKILVVDDKEENLKVAVSLLQLIGFDTLEAVNGLDGIEKFEEWNPDLILMDMRMPVMDGYEATCKIKATEKGKYTPIVAITASSFEEERKKTEAIGMDGYIRKPFRENELFNTIGKLLNIEYIYEEANHNTEKYIEDNEALKNDIALIDNELKSKMMEAIDFADFDKLIELISEIENENIVLAQQLKTHAFNYEYDYLQKLLSK